MTFADSINQDRTRHRGFSSPSENRRTVFLVRNGANVQPVGCLMSPYLCTGIAVTGRLRRSAHQQVFL